DGGGRSLPAGALLPSGAREHESAEGTSWASRVSRVGRTGRRPARMRVMTAPLSHGERWAPGPDRSGGESGKGRGQGPRTARGVAAGPPVAYPLPRYRPPTVPRHTAEHQP